MKLVQPPVTGLSSPGFNEVSMSFILMEADSNPTGMNSTMPYLEIINERSSAYIS
jgi:hypothetical protein